MEDFYYAGGLPALLRELGPRLHKDAPTVNGRTLWQNVAEAPCWNRDVIFPLEQPFKAQGGIAVLTGNLAPQGAAFKPSAATPALMRHRGPAVVFETIEDYDRRIDDSRARGHARLRARAQERRPARVPRLPRGRACSRCRRSCSSAASRTWCASPTRG